MKQSGYTLIELVVALAISAVLLALALPRYDSYEQHINLRNEAQKLANCMQAANSAIMAPAPRPDSSPAIATVSVALTTSNSGSIGCDYQPKDATNGDLPKIFGQSAKAYFCSFSYNDINIVNNLSYSLSLLNRGQIDQINYGGPMVSGNGQGQPFSLQISADSSATATNCTDPVVISVSALGSPIVISS